MCWTVRGGTVAGAENGVEAGAFTTGGALFPIYPRNGFIREYRLVVFVVARGVVPYPTNEIPVLLALRTLGDNAVVELGGVGYAVLRMTEWGCRGSGWPIGFAESYVFDGGPN